MVFHPFHQNQGLIIIDTPGLILGESTPGKDNSMESFPVMLHLEGPFLDGYPCKILHIIGSTLINSTISVCKFCGQVSALWQSNQIVSQKWLILGGIHNALILTSAPELLE